MICIKCGIPFRIGGSGGIYDPVCSPCTEKSSQPNVIKELIK